MSILENPEVRRLEAEKKALLSLLERAHSYVDCAYECAFPDEEENMRLAREIKAAIDGDIPVDQV
jgi:hypothetical protein